MAEKGKRSNPIYGNCRVHHPNGELMFLCLEKRAQWYLSRNLAEVICEEPLTIKLNFIPKGTGNRVDYYLNSKRNICVVCGDDNLEELTRHHVIPVEYRKYFPLDKKSRSSHDVVVICRKHHAKYENRFADSFKVLLESFTDIDKNRHYNKSILYRVYNYSTIMLDEEKIKLIPTERVLFFMEQMRMIFGTDDPFKVSQIDINKLYDDELNNAGRAVVENVKALDQFMAIWRWHFIDTMKPKFLPGGWDMFHEVNTQFNTTY